jgi:hypothetical protein
LNKYPAVFKARRAKLAAVRQNLKLYTFLPKKQSINQHQGA